MAPAASRDCALTADEIAWQQRRQLAAASQARRDEAAAALAEANTELAASLRQVEAKTDDDISDELAGRMRIEFREASEKRRSLEAAAMASANATMRKRTSAVGARTDDDIDGMHRDHKPLSRPHDRAIIALPCDTMRRCVQRCLVVYCKTPET